MTTIKQWFASIRQAIKQWFASIGQVIKPHRERLMLALLILIPAWLLFLLVVGPLKIDATATLIMIWATVAILYLAMDSSILSRIKKIKVMDFELELQEAISKTSEQEFIPIPESERGIFFQKGSMRDLAATVRRAADAPSKPMLLVVNFGRGDSISIPMLFMYVAVLNLTGALTTTLFVSSTRTARGAHDIRSDGIIGVVSGKIVLQTFLGRFPQLTLIFDSQMFRVLVQGFWYPGSEEDMQIDMPLHQIDEMFIDSGVNQPLTQAQVRDWFRGVLSEGVIHKTPAATDIQSVHDAIARGDEYLLVMEGNRLNTVIRVCALTTNFMKNQLNRPLTTQTQ